MKTSPSTLFVVDDDPKSRKAVAALALSMKIKCELFASAEAFLNRFDPSLSGCARSISAWAAWMVCNCRSACARWAASWPWF